MHYTDTLTPQLRAGRGGLPEAVPGGAGEYTDRGDKSAYVCVYECVLHLYLRLSACTAGEFQSVE